jgi:hypothetical protein
LFLLGQQHTVWQPVIHGRCFCEVVCVNLAAVHAQFHGNTYHEYEITNAKHDVATPKETKTFKTTTHPTKKSTNQRNCE